MTFTDMPDTLPANIDSLATSLAPDRVPALDSALQRTTPSTVSRCDDPEVQQIISRYRPRLARGPITQAAPYSADLPAKSAIPVRSPSIGNLNETPVPAVTLIDPRQKDRWEATHDLLGNNESDTNFVVEVESDGASYLRFGDGVSGERPEEGTKFLATYRVGNGIEGNVGADAITHLVTSDAGISDKEIVRISNPIPARGGLDPETIEEVRRNAPGSFRIQQRAVTPADYEEITTRRDVVERCNLDVQRAAATLRWTGSWHTVFVSADRFGGAAVDEDFETSLRRCLERYRMAGQDLEVEGPMYVPLEIELAVCVKRDYFFEDVQSALLEIFSNRVRPNGTLGVFHPDNFTFGQPVYSSALVAAAQSVAGVDSVTLRKFQRQRIDSDVALKSGKLELARLEIARLDNDPNFPERGSFTVRHA
jgi:predicted phage baseplate assembly protein